MADFSLAQIGEAPVQGSGPSPLPAVAEPSAANAALTSAAGIGGSILKIFQDQHSAQVNKAVGRFAHQQLEIANAVDRGDLPSQEARIRMRTNLARAGADNPNLYEDFAKAHKDIIGTAGMGKVAEEGTEQEQAFFKIQAEAMKTGWVAPGMTTEQQEESTNAYIKFKREQEKIDAQQNQIALERAKIGKQTDIIQQGTALVSNKQARLNLAESEAAIESRKAATSMADAYTTRMLNKFNNIESQVESGQLDENEAARLMQEEWLVVQNTIQEAGRLVDTTDMENLTAPMRRIFETKMGFITGEFGRKVMEERIQSNLTATKLNLLNDPELSGVVATSQLVGQGGSLALQGPLTSAARRAVEMIGKNGQEAGRPVDVTEGEQGEAVDRYIGIVNNALDKANSGSLANEQEARAELETNLNNILKGVGSYGNLVENPQDLNRAINLLSGEKYGQYVSQGQTSIRQENANAAASVIKAQYEDVIRPLIAEEWRNASQLTMEVFDPARPETAGQTEPVSGAIRPFFTSGGLSFIVANPDQSNSQIERKVRELNNRVGKPLTRLIKAGAHLEGHTNYQKIYEANYAQMFGDPGTGASAAE